MRKESLQDSIRLQSRSPSKSKLSKKQMMSLEKQYLSATMQMQKLKQEIQSLNQSKKSLESQKAKLQQKVDMLEKSQNTASQKEKKFSVEKIELLKTFGVQHKQAAKTKFSEIASFKEILNLLVTILKEGTVQGRYFSQILNQISKASADLINFIQSPQFTEKLTEIRSIYKTNKNEIMTELRKKFEEAVKKNCSQEKQLIEKERDMIREIPIDLKEIKEASKSREEIYRKHIQLLQKQIKQNEVSYMILQNDSKRQIQKLTQKYVNLLAIYNKEVQIPLTNLTKKVENQIQLIKIEFQKANSSINIQDVTKQLISVIDKYLKQSQQRQEADGKKTSQNLTMQKLEQIKQKLGETLYRIDQAFSKRDSISQQINQFLDMRVRQEEEKSKEQKKYYNSKELQTKSIYQREYIVMLQKYQNKLQSCIKRISADSTLENEWKKQKQEYDERKAKFQAICSEVKQSNEKVVSELIQLKKIQITNKNSTSQLRLLFEQCLNQVKEIKNFREQLIKFIDNQRHLKRLINDQTYKFHSMFMEHYSNLINLKDEIPVVQKICEQKASENHQKAARDFQQIRKGYQELAKCKKIVETRLSKGINDILRVHEEYLKFARSKTESIRLNIDQKLLNSMSNRIYVKLQEVFGTLRQFKECILKIDFQSRSNYQNSKSQAKKLLNHMRSSKMDQSIINLINVIEGDQQYSKRLIELLDTYNTKK